MITALRRLRPDVTITGVAGPAMREAGCEAFLPSERIAVMGIVEVLRHYRSLRRMQRDIGDYMIENRPDVLVGIDAPDFNLDIEERCRQAGIPTVHYVSPTVWAWREGRVRKLARATDLIMTLFPFEEGYYRERNVAAVFVGHPLADEIPDATDRQAARKSLGLAQDQPVLALLPGSRASEMQQHASTFIETAALCTQTVAGLQCAVPVVNDALATLFRSALAARSEKIDVHMVDGRAHEVLSAADVVLTASGTAAVETMLHKRPMVVAYRVAWLSYWVIRALIRIPYICMPNVLAGRALVPEFVQADMVAEPMAQQLTTWLRNPEKATAMLQEFDAAHRNLRRGANERAAQAVLALAQTGPGRR